MYCLGDKYDIPTLKALAQVKFGKVVNANIKCPEVTEEITNAVPLIYEGIPASDRALRDLQVKSIRCRLPHIVEDQACKDDFAKVLRITPDFSTDLVYSYAEQLLLLDCYKCGPMQRLDAMKHNAVAVIIMRLVWVIRSDLKERRTS